MNINQMMPSKYLKKDDVPQPALVTIRKFSHENVAQQDQAEEKKWVLHFDEFDRGLVMNSTNLQLAAVALGSDETDEWVGRQIVLYSDPNVSFGGKLVGGLRLRAVRTKAPAPAVQRTPPAQPAQRQVPAEPFADMDDEPPF